MNRKDFRPYDATSTRIRATFLRKVDKRVSSTSSNTIKTKGDTHGK